MIQHLGDVWTALVLAWFAFIFWPRAVEDNHELGSGTSLLDVTPIVTDGVYVDTTEFDPGSEVNAA